MVILTVEVELFYFFTTLSIFDICYLTVLLISVIDGWLLFSTVILLLISLFDSGVDIGLLIYFYSKFFSTVLFSVWLAIGAGPGALSVAGVVVLFKMTVGTD